MGREARSKPEPQPSPSRADEANLGLYLERDDAVTANYYLIDHESALQKQFDHWAQW